jgi:hypothetical protein
MRMKYLLVGIVWMAAAFFGANALAANISTIEAGGPDTLVTLDSNPVITSILSQPGTFGARTYLDWSFLVQDSTGSIDIYGTPVLNGYTPKIGDAITLFGTNSPSRFAPYNQIPEIVAADVVRVSSGNPVAPTVATIPQLSQTTLPFSIAGYDIELQNVLISCGPATFSSANTSYTIRDAANDSMTLLFSPATYSTDGAMVGNTVPTGLVDIFGIDSVSGTGGSATAQFIPIAITAAPEPGAVSVLAASGALLALGLRKRR